MGKITVEVYKNTFGTTLYNLTHPTHIYFFTAIPKPGFFGYPKNLGFLGTVTKVDDLTSKKKLH